MKLSIIMVNCNKKTLVKKCIKSLLSQPRDITGLANNILKLLRDDNLRIHLAKAGYKSIQNFTWEKSTDLLEQELSGC